MFQYGTLTFQEIEAYKQTMLGVCEKPDSKFVKTAEDMITLADCRHLEAMLGKAFLLPDQSRDPKVVALVKAAPKEASTLVAPAFWAKADAILNASQTKPQPKKVETKKPSGR